MRIEVQHLDRSSVLRLKGRLDLEHVARLSEAVTEALNQSKRFIVLNMIDVSDISSTGIGKILTLARECESRGAALAISDPSAVVDYVLDLARMKDIFSIYPNDEEALKHLRRVD
ncbi:MAG: STAS domain-containing protein [Leptospiraceae bacterium]